jgi:hypothetical protein
MEQLQALAPVLALAGAVLGFVGVVGWATLLHRFQRFARPYEELARVAEKEGTQTALQAQLLGVERNEKRIDETRAYATRIETQLKTALQGIGFLKYDAFEDIRGQQSYSLCLLDAHQDGVVITSIAGRNDYRGYAKPVKTGKCDLAMSEEEKQVLEMSKVSLTSHGAETPRPAAAAPEPRKKAAAAV